MKILLVSNHFSLPHQPGAPRPWKVAHYLNTLGHNVTVITNRRHYFDENIKIGGAKHTTPQVVEGIRIVGVETTTGRRKYLIINDLLSYRDYTPSMRELFLNNLFRAELLKVLKYPQDQL